MTTHFMSCFQRLGLALILVLASQLQACADDEPAKKSYSQIEQFWPVFRKAALDGDKKTLLQLTQIPLVTRGMMDDDPLIPLDQKRLEKNIDIILAQDPGDPYTPNPETTLDLFKRTPEIKEQGTGFARVGDLEFHLVDGRWLWVRAYINEDELK